MVVNEMNKIKGIIEIIKNVLNTIVFKYIYITILIFLIINHKLSISKYIPIRIKGDNNEP